MRSSVDTGRLAEAVRQPGIDPRLWITLAIVEELGSDPEHGVYADVRYLPSGDKDTALVATGYAGDGFGAWAPLAVGDLVLITLPNGDAGNGPTLFARLWSASERPPREIAASAGADPPDHPIVVLGPGQALEVVCRPGATVVVRGDSPGAPVPVALGPANDLNWTELAKVLDAWQPIALDGGAALKTLLTALLQTGWPASTAATLLKGE